jgi:putative heme-binding domain-containing protein
MYPLSQPQAWRIERTRLRQQRYHDNKLENVRPLSPSTEMAAGYFTGASGGTIYSGDQFPEKYRGNLFTGDVSGNLVHRDVLSPDGVTFTASRAPEEREREFLASTDQWFRPCNFANAPDGNFYVVDMYREFIEAPSAIPDAIKRTMNFWSGDTLGRIFRIVPKRPTRTTNLKPNLGWASIPELVKTLENSNGWQRDTAHRLLIERQDRTAIPLLKQLLAKSQFAPARILSLWCLESLSTLDESSVLTALKDSDPRVREHAVRIVEEFIPVSNLVEQTLFTMTSDPDARVQFQLAFTLGQIRGERVIDALVDLASRHADDQWFRIAVLSSVQDSAIQFLDRGLSKKKLADQPELLSQLASLIGAKHAPAEIGHFLGALSKVSQPDAALSGLTRGLELAGVKTLRVPDAETLMKGFLSSPSEQVQKAAWETARYLEMPELSRQAASDALAPGLSMTKRLNAVRALRSAPFSRAGLVLRKVLESQPGSELQSGAIESLASFEDASVAPALIASWKSYNPTARARAMAALLNQRDRIPLLLQSLENHQLELNSVDAAGRARLLQYPDISIRERARSLLQGNNSDRMKVVANYQGVLKMTGNPESGKKVFEETCGKCHLPRKQGGRVGPDLSGISSKTKEELLTSILNPSFAIEPQFTNYIVTTKDGGLHDGIIANETPGTVTLRGGTALDETLLRNNIIEMRASSISVMPDDLETSLSRQDLADVISYLRGGL